jgi:hypothetical protein
MMKYLLEKPNSDTDMFTDTSFVVTLCILVCSERGEGSLRFYSHSPAASRPTEGLERFHSLTKTKDKLEPRL